MAGTEDSLRDIASITALFAAMTAVGVATVYALGLPFTREWAATTVGLSPMTGTLVCGLVATVCTVAGVGVHPAVVVVVSAGLIGMMFLVARKRRPRAWPHRSRHRSRPLLALEAALLCAVLGVGWIVLGMSVITPLLAWDGWAIWALHAHAIYSEGSTSSPVFTEPLYAGSHPEYPILLPALEAMSARALGRFDPVLIDVVPALILTSAALAIWGVLRTLTPGWIAAATALGVVGAPELVENVGAHYADGVLAVITALGVLLLAIWLVSASSLALVLSCLYLACAAVTKGEGVLFAGAALAAALVAISGSGRPKRPLATASTVILAPVALWYAVATARGAHDRSFDPPRLLDPTYLANHTGRISQAAGAMLEFLAVSWFLSLGAVLLAVVLALVQRRLRLAVFLSTWLGLSFSGLVLAYLVSRADIDWHLRTSADRVVFSLGLVAFVIAPLVLWDAWDRGGRAVATSSPVK